ncbi:hypothetical protein MR478_05045 [bacterium]|nr:hypothetical protein [bacterium]
MCGIIMLPRKWLQNNARVSLRKTIRSRKSRASGRRSAAPRKFSTDVHSAILPDTTGGGSGRVRPPEVTPAAQKNRNTFLFLRQDGNIYRCLGGSPIEIRH